ncbi:MAG TPA: hypothetical protein VFQ38_12145 [Longimicrobiales bacterium]|nr:hypothetical protein [Longimicrobiales bacterium]
MSASAASAPEALAPVRPVFRAVAEAIVPESAALDEAGWRELERIVEWQLGERPPALRRQLVLFLRALNLLPLARYGRTLTSLDVARRSVILRSVQDSPALVLRRGLWGVRTLVFMGYYGRAAAAAEIGYRADPRGWEARR